MHLLCAPSDDSRLTRMRTRARRIRMITRESHLYVYR